MCTLADPRWEKIKTILAMDDSELFDVFNVDNNPEPETKTIPTQNKTQKAKKPKKSKEDKSTTNQRTSSNGATGKRFHEDLSTKSDVEEDDVEVVSKKPRKIDETPVIVDSFETESDQIVPATQGLQGIAPKDQNIVIKKRVTPRSDDY
jgi:FtsZ-interacting cell division protein YlmF